MVLHLKSLLDFLEIVLKLGLFMMLGNNLSSRRINHRELTPKITSLIIQSDSLSHYCRLKEIKVPFLIVSMRQVSQPLRWKS